MSREEFENLKVGDKIIHAFGGVGVVTEKEENGYTVKDKGFDTGDGCCEVSFAWNEGEKKLKQNNMELIDKATVKAIIGRMQDCTMDEDGNFYSSSALAEYNILCDLENRLDTIEVKDPYEQCVQYDSIKAGIQAHAETYSFNIESELFNQLTKEQQKLWRKEIEQAVISGGDAGVELARDPRYKENLEMKEVDLEKEIKRFTMSKELYEADSVIKAVAEHFFELGLKAQKEE